MARGWLGGGSGVARDGSCSEVDVWLRGSGAARGRLGGGSGWLGLVVFSQFEDVCVGPSCLLLSWAFWGKNWAEAVISNKFGSGMGPFRKELLRKTVRGQISPFFQTFPPRTHMLRCFLVFSCRNSCVCTHHQNTSPEGFVGPSAARQLEALEFGAHLCTQE